MTRSGRESVRRQQGGGRHDVPCVRRDVRPAGGRRAAGEQHRLRTTPEKAVPLFVTNALDGLPLPVYGEGLQMRDRLYVEDNVRALLLLLERGEPGEAYNIQADNHRPNIDVARASAGPPRQAVRPASASSRTAPGTTPATTWTGRSSARSAGSRRTTSTRCSLWRRRAVVRRQPRVVGTRLSPATSARTTSGSTASASPAGARTGRRARNPETWSPGEQYVTRS